MTSDPLAAMVESLESDEITPTMVIAQFELSPGKVSNLIVDLSRNSHEFVVGLFFIDLINSLSGMVSRPSQNSLAISTVVFN